jgi:hypothetical protein
MRRMVVAYPPASPEGVACATVSGWLRRSSRTDGSLPRGAAGRPGCKTPLASCCCCPFARKRALHNATFLGALLHAAATAVGWLQRLTMGAMLLTSFSKTRRAGRHDNITAHPFWPWRPGWRSIPTTSWQRNPLISISLCNVGRRTCRMLPWTAAPVQLYTWKYLRPWRCTDSLHVDAPQQRGCQPPFDAQLSYI